jgi:putative tricarboxylic transport membrane protein
VEPSAPALFLRQDFIGGVVVIAVGVLAYWLASGLAIGTLGGMGPGMLPRALAVLLAALGVMLVVASIVDAGLPLTAASLRGPVFVLGALIAFGLTVRPLGLVGAGPIAIIISALASDEIKWGETIVSGILTTLFCVGLFKFALGLPIPLAPWLLGY